MNTKTGSFLGRDSNYPTRWFGVVRRFYEKYERYLIPGALLIGVTTDALLFQNINLNLAFSILTWHLFLSGLTIIFIQSYDAGRFPGEQKRWRYLRLFAPLVLQYTFGALLSGFLIFYWFSSSFTASWPFIALIVFLMVSNDLLKKYYLWLNIQLGVYYFIVFSYCVLVLPFLFRSIEVWVFFLSGVVSLVVMAGYMYVMIRYVPAVGDRKRFLVGLLAGIFLGINFLYFTNIIPPVPLSLREAGVYHSVRRSGVGDYEIVASDRPWWQGVFWRPTIEILAGEPVYVFASVFAPTRLDIVVVHHWQYRDPETGNWQSRARVSYDLIGGRDGGYRGYSFLTRPEAGRWRVNIETERGQVIGRESFVVDQVSQIEKREVIRR